MNEKTHYRKAFDSPYLSSADIVEPTALTISYVRLEPDHTKKTKDLFNTAYFSEKELRKGEKLKPMILNATNSKIMRKHVGSPYIDDWENIPVTVFVDGNVRFGRETVEGLRLMPRQVQKKFIDPTTQPAWDNAKAAFKRDGHLDKVLERVNISPENMQLIFESCGDV